MAEVFVHAVVSVDGFIADDNDEVGPLFDWYFNGDEPIVDSGPFRVDSASVGYVRSMWERIGTTVMGRRLFDRTNRWDGTPPAGDVVAMDVVPVDNQHLLEDPDVVVRVRGCCTCATRCAADAGDRGRPRACPPQTHAAATNPATRTSPLASRSPTATTRRRPPTRATMGRTERRQ